MWPSAVKYVNEKNHKIVPDGATYVGNFVKDYASGTGVFSWPDGRKYTGEYKQGRANGKGTEEWPNGARYVGSFKDDIK